MTFEKKKDNVYEQIVMEYKCLISLNILRKGDKLSSCRDLAREKGINPNTVSKAYTCLEDQGYIEAITKKGVYIPTTPPIYLLTWFGIILSIEIPIYEFHFKMNKIDVDKQ